MDARNLAVCISPNLLPVEPLSLDKVEKVTALTQFLIENCSEILGDGLQTLAVDPAEEDRLADSTDSLSSHGQDSAYNSADPEAEADPAADRPPSPVAAATPSRRPGQPVGMRKLLSRAQGDEGDRLVQPLAKQASHDSFLLPSRVRLCHLPQYLDPAMLHSASMDTLLSLARGNEGDRLVQPLAKQASYDSFLCPPGGQ
ncbi:T-cell activation Rho GTPase-activating protein-like [Anguilla anguilla]|uniref:T-cell activation Rho GTPase-activating protein-like n=1 Tax=Anguilla anguilla TaxID=7936 RepID=UPI0015AD9204|nr:T-cell activation Rho GTPase-activating protein-like [Anguilla anguilla]